MSFSNVYINNTSHFLPNEPVQNEEMESYLGLIDDKPSKSRRIVLHWIRKEGRPIPMRR